MQRFELAGTTAGSGKTGPIGLHCALFFQPRQCLLKYLRCSYIGRHHDAVMYPFSFPARGDYSGASQVRKVAGYFRLRLIQNLDEVTDADFLVAHEVEET